MMALAGIVLETLVSEPDALTTRPPPLGPCATSNEFNKCSEYYCIHR